MSLFSRKLSFSVKIPVLALLMLFVMPATALAAINATQGVSTENAVNIIPNPQYIEGLPEVQGCLICHADMKLKDDKVLKALYFSPDTIKKSAHYEVGCAGCHSNYTEKPTDSHELISEAGTEDFIKIARASCVKCKDHNKQVKEMSVSAHTGEPTLEALTDQPTCLDCHTFHDEMNMKKDKAWAAERHMDAINRCGKCHKSTYANYSDYYHGRAYKMGMEAAPACWDCHGNHSIMYAQEKGSLVTGDNLVKTCRKCHKTGDKAFAAYAPLVHQHDKLFMKNPLVVWFVNLIKSLMPKPALKIES
jgi:hypothetical protein